MAHCKSPVCEVQWCNKQGNPTPDPNLAIGVAVCSFPWGGTSRPIPICESHAKEAIPLSNWKITRFLHSCK